MKVGIVTYHSSRSYGAFFQCFATLKALQSSGYDAEIIDYRNEFEQTYIRVKKLNLETLKRILKIIVKDVIFGMHRLEGKAFENSINMYGGAITEKRYSAIEDMSELEYDCLLVGSDQMWNLNISGGIDPVFLLQFGKAKRRISYATSMGSYCLKEDEAEAFGLALKSFDAISVREDFTKNQLMPLVNQEITVVGDPTILLTQEQWKSMLSKGSKIIPKTPYILTFFVGGNYKTYKDRIERFNSDLHLPVYCIQASRIQVCRGYHVLCGIKPDEFLTLIRSAERVITDSFHGTSFALYFEKDIIVLSNKSNPYRTKELMNRLGLENRVDPNNIEEIEMIDYVKINRRLDKMREQSLQWLKGNLDGKESKY